MTGRDRGRVCAARRAARNSRRSVPVPPGPRVRARASGASCPRRGGQRHAEALAQRAHVREVAIRVRAAQAVVQMRGDQREPNSCAMRWSPTSKAVESAPPLTATSTWSRARSGRDREARAQQRLEAAQSRSAGRERSPHAPARWGGTDRVRARSYGPGKWCGAGLEPRPEIMIPALPAELHRQNRGAIRRMVGQKN